MGTKWKGLGGKAGTRQVGRAAINRAAETGRVTLVPLNLPAGRLIVQTIRLVSLPSPTASFLPLRSLCSILILGLTRFILSGTSLWEAEGSVRNCSFRSSAVGFSQPAFPFSISHREGRFLIQAGARSVWRFLSVQIPEPLAPKGNGTALGKG